MANKKRNRSYKIQKFGCYYLTTKDILVLQKILRRYADVCESMKDSISGRAKSLPYGRGVMPRNRMDMHVRVGSLSADSVTLLPKSIKKISRLIVSVSPGIDIEFKPFSTTIGSQENYATGIELKAMRETVSEIIKYMSTRKKYFYNLINLDI